MKNTSRVHAASPDRRASLRSKLAMLCAPALCFPLAAGAAGAEAAPALVNGASSTIGDGGMPEFYTWQGSVPTKPGMLLRQEPLESAFSLDNAGQAVRLLYTSTNWLDRKTPVYVSGALFLPKGPTRQGGWPLVAWAHGTTGIADTCAPSATPRSERDTQYLNYWLDQGYAVVSTDYQGLGTPGLHPYRHFDALANSVLDSVRAVRHGDFPISEDVVVIGQSEGGGAGFATVTQAQRYAPELRVRGAVLTGVPSPAVARYDLGPEVEGDPNITPVLYALSALRMLHGGFVPQDHLAERGLGPYEDSQSMCEPQANARFSEEGIALAGAMPGPDRAAVEPLLEDSLRYGSAQTRIPIFWGSGLADINIPAWTQRELVEAACRAGDSIDWHVYPGLDHGGTVNGSVPDSAPFVARAFAGQAQQSNCGALPNLP